MSAFQSTDRWELVRLVDSGGAGVTALIFSAVTVQYRYGGAVSWTAKTLTSPDWAELGSGYYYLRFKAAELTAVGTLVFKITSGSTVPYFAQLQVEPQPLAFQAAPGICIVTGNIVDLGGEADRSARISVRPARMPASIGPSILSASLVTTYPDALGNFSVALVQGSTALIEVTPIGINNQITVPNTQSATLLSLLPDLNA